MVLDCAMALKAGERVETATIDPLSNRANIRRDEAIAAGEKLGGCRGGIAFTEIRGLLWKIL